MEKASVYITIGFSNYCKVPCSSETGGTTVTQFWLLFWAYGSLNIFAFVYSIHNFRKAGSHKVLNSYHLQWNQVLVVGWDPSFLPCPWESAKWLTVEVARIKHQTTITTATTKSTKKPEPSISMDIFHIQTIKASGLSIRLTAVNLLAKRDVSVSHNLMYTFRQFHGSLSSSSFFFIWDLFQSLSQILSLAVKAPQQHSLDCVEPQDTHASLGDPGRKNLWSSKGIVYF